MSLLKNNKRFNSCLVTYTYKGCEKYLNRFKKTILQQNFKNFDVIIFNDKGDLRNFKINHPYKIINNSKKSKRKNIFQNTNKNNRHQRANKQLSVNYSTIFSQLIITVFEKGSTLLRSF